MQFVMDVNRHARCSISGQFLFIMARGNHTGRTLFADADGTARCFLETLAEACQKIGHGS
jgi:hypothetical protein